MQHVQGYSGSSSWNVYGDRRKWWKTGHQELDDKVNIGFDGEFRPQPRDHRHM